MPFGLSLSTVKLIGLALLALFIAGLLVTIKIQHSNNLAMKAQVTAALAQRDEALAANKGLAGQVTSLTADAAKAKAQAKTDHDALVAEQAASTATLTQTVTEIDHVAVASDNVCSPAIAAAFGRVCGATAPAADGHAAAPD